MQALSVYLKTLWYRFLLWLRNTGEPTQYVIPSCRKEYAGYWNDVAPWQRQLLTHLYRLHTGISTPDPRWFGIHGVGGHDDPPPHFVWNAVVPMSPALVEKLNALGYERMVQSVLPAFTFLTQSDGNDIGAQLLDAHNAAIPGAVAEQVEAHRASLLLNGLPEGRAVKASVLTENLTVRVPDPPADPSVTIYTFLIRAEPTDNLLSSPRSNS